MQKSGNLSYLFHTWTRQTGEYSVVVSYMNVSSLNRPLSPPRALLGFCFLKCLWSTLLMIPHIFRGTGSSQLWVILPHWGHLARSRAIFDGCCWHLEGRGRDPSRNSAVHRAALHSRAFPGQKCQRWRAEPCCPLSPVNSLIGLIKSHCAVPCLLTRRSWKIILDISVCLRFCCSLACYRSIRYHVQR